LTNIALLLRTYPEPPSASNDSCSWGDHHGRRGFNVGHDQSTAIVLDALAAELTTMYGLDVFYGPAP